MRDDFEDFDDFLPGGFLPPVLFDRGRRSASDDTTDAARSAASVAASRARITSRSNRSICSWSRATTSRATRSAVSRASSSAARSALLGSATAAARAAVLAGGVAFEADFLALVAVAGAFFAAVFVTAVFFGAVLFVGAVFVGAVFVVAAFVGVFLAVVFLAGGRVVVFEVELSVAAMLFSIRASWPGRNRGAIAISCLRANWR